MVLLFLDISGGELLLILIVVFIVFGPKKVPDVARQIGKGMNDLKKATSDLTREFREGAGEAAREINKARSEVTTESEKIRSEILSGPSTFPDDPEPPRATDQEAVRGPDAGPGEDPPEGPVPRNPAPSPGNPS